VNFIFLNKKRVGYTSDEEKTKIVHTPQTHTHKTVSLNEKNANEEIIKANKKKELALLFCVVKKGGGDPHILVRCSRKRFFFRICVDPLVPPSHPPLLPSTTSAYPL
jgi:hypothetical protein